MNAFKPQFLDKLLIILQIFGVIHIKKTTTMLSQKLKQKALLIYNIIVMCSNVVYLFMYVGDRASNMRYMSRQNFFYYMDFISSLLLNLWSTICIVLLFILSRKSKLCSVPKPKNWEALPAKYENNMPLHHRISYITSIITILCAMVTFIVTLSMKAFGHGTSGYEMCFDTVHSTV